MDIWDYRTKGHKFLVSNRFNTSHRKNMIEGVVRIYEDGGSPLDILCFILGYIDSIN